MGTLWSSFELKGTFCNSIIKMLKESLFIVAIIIASCESACEYPWIQPGQNSKCYQVSPQRGNWYDADKFCKQSGGMLAEPRSVEESELIDGLMVDKSADVAWIGLTDLWDEGIFLWDSDYSEPYYTNWATNKPSGFDDHDCVNTWSTKNQWGYRGWFDDPCSGNLYPYAVCQKDSEI